MEPGIGKRVKIIGFDQPGLAPEDKYDHANNKLRTADPFPQIAYRYSEKIVRH